MDIRTAATEVEAELRKTPGTERLADKLAAGLSHYTRPPGRFPFGYRQLANGQLVQEARQQKALARMREWRAEGDSYRVIQGRLKSEFGYTLSPYGIQRILENLRKIE